MKDEGELMIKLFIFNITILVFSFILISCANNYMITNTDLYNSIDFTCAMSDINELPTSTTVSENVEPTEIEMPLEPYLINNIVFSNIPEFDPKVTQDIERPGNIRYLHNLQKSFDLYVDEPNKKFAACLLLYYEVELHTGDKLHSKAMEKELLYNGKNADELLNEYNKSLDECYKAVDELLNSGRIGAEVDEQIRNEYRKTEPAHIAYKNLLFSEIFEQLKKSDLLVIELNNPLYSTYSYGNYPTCIVVGTKEQLDNSMIFDNLCWIYGLSCADELKNTNNIALEKLYKYGG